MSCSACVLERTATEKNPFCELTPCKRLLFILLTSSVEPDPNIRYLSSFCCEVGGCFFKIPDVCSSSKFLLNCGVWLGASFGASIGSTFSSSEVWPRLKLSNEFLFWGTKSPPKYAYEFPIKNEAKIRINNKDSTLCIFD